MAVTNKLKEARLEKNLLQADLARAVQCDVQTICRYETGKHCPSLEIALRIADILEKSVDDLFQAV